MSQIQITELLRRECLYSTTECRQLNDLDIVFLFPCSSMFIFQTSRRGKRDVRMKLRGFVKREKEDEK